jgi:hypothetical protein
MAAIEGHCLCKAVTFQCDAPPNWTCYCHCESCRRAASSPVAAWTSVPRAQLTFTGKAPTYYMSSPGVRRGFCNTCGSPMTYETERLPNEVHLYTASFTRPQDHSPTSHVFVAEQLPWFEVHDNLPRYAERGSAEETPARTGVRK